MLDHVTIGVSDLERSKAFYDKALKAIGIEHLYSEGAEFFGYGAHKKAFFWIGLDPQRKLSGEDATLQPVRGRWGGRERDARQDHPQTVRSELDPVDYPS